MTDKQRIEQLEQEIQASHQREADLFKTIAEGKNLENQIYWRPWQVVLIPTFISVLALIAAIVK